MQTAQAEPDESNFPSQEKRREKRDQNKENGKNNKHTFTSRGQEGPGSPANFIITHQRQAPLAPLPQRPRSATRIAFFFFFSRGGIGAFSSKFPCPTPAHACIPRGHTSQHNFLPIFSRSSPAPWVSSPSRLPNILRALFHHPCSHPQINRERSIFHVHTHSYPPRPFPSSQSFLLEITCYGGGKAERSL